MESFDAIVVGAGPAGSTCARWLVASGARVALIDAARFPRDKLCAGWVSAPFWHILKLRPAVYPGDLWAWDRCHIYAGGQRYSRDIKGHFIRRLELDAYLVELSGASRFEGHRVRRLERDRGGQWVVDGAWRAPFLIGAGGTHCPVARALFPPKPEPPVGTQERELPAPPEAVARHRVGADGEPELVLLDNVLGYAWNVPKRAWLNVGVGTRRARDVREAWRQARAFFAARGHLPPEAGPQLDRVKGHAYYVFHPQHLRSCEQQGAFLVGDALGLAHPFTAEGIVPSVLSGRLCAEAIARRDPALYRARLERHPIIRDYALCHRLREVVERFQNGRAPEIVERSGALDQLAQRLAVGFFARLLSGRPLLWGAAPGGG